MSGLTVVEYAIAQGGCAAYYPEANVLVALSHHDHDSHTPAYKSIWVQVIRSAPACERGGAQRA